MKADYPPSPGIFYYAFGIEALPCSSVYSTPRRRVADVIIVPAAGTPTERIELAIFDQSLTDVSEKIGR